MWQWLENGAHFYICGDAERMAKDVHQALLDVAVKFGGKTIEQAEEYLETLRAAKRYQKDVYWSLFEQTERIDEALVTDLPAENIKE